MIGRTVIQQLNSLFNMGSELEDSMEPVVVDTELSTVSTNPVENKVITNKIEELDGKKQNNLSAGTGIVIDNNTVSSIVNPADYYTIAELQVLLANDKTASTSITAGEEVGTFHINVILGDGSIYKSNAFNYQKLYNVEIISGSTPNSFKIRYTLTDNTTLTSNDYTIGLITQDKYMTGLSFTPNLVDGTFYATISYNDGTTAVSNEIAAPIGSAQISQINDLIDTAVLGQTFDLSTTDYQLTVKDRNGVTIATVDLSVFGGGYSKDEIDAKFIQMNEAKLDKKQVTGNAGDVLIVGDDKFVTFRSDYTKSEIDAKFAERDTDIADLATEITTKQDILTFDTTPTPGSMNPVTSDGISKMTFNIVDDVRIEGDINEYAYVDVVVDYDGAAQDSFDVQYGVFSKRNTPVKVSVCALYIDKIRRTIIDKFSTDKKSVVFNNSYRSMFKPITTLPTFDKTFRIIRYANGADPTINKKVVNASSSATMTDEESCSILEKQTGSSTTLLMPKFIHTATELDRQTINGNLFILYEIRITGIRKTYDFSEFYLFARNINSGIRTIRLYWNPNDMVTTVDKIIDDPNVLGYFQLTDTP